MRNTAFHQANMVAQEAVAEMKAMQETVLEALNSQSAPVINNLPRHHANSAESDAQSEILSILCTMKTEIAELKKGKTAFEAQPDKKKNKNKEKKTFERIVSSYCWTHGATNHSSCNCRNPMGGHQKAATFDNKLGGFTNFCK